MADFKYPRVLLKLSGEALLGDGSVGIDPAVISRMAMEVCEVVKAGVEVGIVIGGGNFLRGSTLAGEGMGRVTADYMGMLATVMNALALQEALEFRGASVRTMSAVTINQVCEPYVKRRAVRHLEKKRIVLFAAGTGNPFFTTDSAASLRAIEIGADILLKATKVDGVYSADPMKDKGAVKYDELSFDTAIQKRLGVMDGTAMTLCRENNMPVRVFNIHEETALRRILLDNEPLGTLISIGEDDDNS